MSNGATHIAASGLGVLAFTATQEYFENGEVTWKPFALAGLAAKTAKLPDLIEPAFHSNNAVL